MHEENGNWMVVLTALDTPEMGGADYALSVTACHLRWAYRHIAIAGQKGHVATFNWQTGVLHNELQLNETIRDIT